MRNFLDRIIALVTGHDTETAQLWLRMYWGFAMAPVTSLLNFILTGWGPIQWVSAVLSIILVMAMDNMTNGWIVAWFVLTLLCNNGIIWILALIAMIAMIRQRPTEVPTPRRSSDVEEHPGSIRATHYIGVYSDRYDAKIDYRAHALVPILRLPIPWVTYILTDQNVIIRDVFLGGSDPEKLSLIQNQNHTDTLLMNILGCGTYRFQTKKIGEVEYKEWHNMPSWLITKVSGRWEKK